jgi:hypothetical protein
MEIMKSFGRFHATTDSSVGRFFTIEKTTYEWRLGTFIPDLVCQMLPQDLHYQCWLNHHKLLPNTFVAFCR